METDLETRNPQAWPKHISDAARSILRHYNECDYTVGDGMRFWGPHYVTWEQGTFMLRPFGWLEDWRYSFQCVPYWDRYTGDGQPYWAFNVML